MFGQSSQLDELHKTRQQRVDDLQKCSSACVPWMGTSAVQRYFPRQKNQLELDHAPAPAAPRARGARPSHALVGFA